MISCLRFVASNESPTILRISRRRFMNSREALKLAIDAGDMVGLPYLEDLTDKEMLHRPCAECNHINWQVGHLIVSENQMINQSLPGSMPPLPAGFAERYTKDTATSNDPNVFCKKDELLRTHKQQRAAALAALEKVTDQQLDGPSGFDFVPSVGGLFSMLG